MGGTDWRPRRYRRRHDVVAMLISPDLPDRDRGSVAALEPYFENGWTLPRRPGFGAEVRRLALYAWWTPLVVGVSAAAVSQVVMSQGLSTTTAVIAAASVVLVPAVLVGARVALARRRDRNRARQIERWSHYVITVGRQRDIADDFPEIGDRLNRLSGLVIRLRDVHAPALAHGLLGGMTSDLLASLHYRIVAQLLATVDTRAAVRAVGRQASLADRADAVRRSIAAVDSDVDARLDQLQELCDLADRQHADEVMARLATRLDVALLTSPIDPFVEVDLDAVLAGAHTSTDVIHQATQFGLQPPGLDQVR